MSTMGVKQEIIEEIQSTPIQNFYKDANIFITGSTGFLGRILLEKLLRSCPDISTVFLLVRNKKEKNLATRIDELFDDVIFERLRSECPKFRHKVVGIEGDCCLPDLGISEQDQRMLIAQVNIVFHAAATVRFDEKMKLAVAINVKAPMYLIEMAKQMNNLKCFMHVSTAYTNCTESTIEERIYQTPMDSEKLISITDNLSDKILDNVTPQLIGKWPNTYTFTKAIAENTVAKGAKGIPAGIFRPAIIISTYREPIPAWINNMYGPTGICAAAGTGIMRTLQCDGSVNGNMVPVDMCVNSLIAAAYKVGTDYEKNKADIINQELPVFHYESSNDKPITWGRFMELNQTYGVNYPSIRAMWCYTLTLQKNRYSYLLLMFILHIIPAAIVDFGLFCLGKRPMLLKLYKKIHKFSDVLSYFTTRTFKYKSSKVRDLIDQMTEKDKELFFCDLRQLDWEKYFEVYLKGVRIHLLRDDLSSLEDARTRWNRFVFLHKTLKVILVLIFVRLLWQLCSYAVSLVY